MRKNYYFKKTIIVCIVILFIVIAFSPSINSEVIKNNDKNLVKINVEIYGSNVGKYSVFLSEKEAYDVDKLFEDMRSKLENGFNTIEVFNDAVVQLDTYGLLRGISVEEAQKLVTNNLRKDESFNNLLKINNVNAAENFESEKTRILETSTTISSTLDTNKTIQCRVRKFRFLYRGTYLWPKIILNFLCICNFRQKIIFTLINWYDILAFFVKSSYENECFVQALYF